MKARQRTTQAARFRLRRSEGQRPDFIPALGNAQGGLFPTEKGLKARHHLMRVETRIVQIICPSALRFSSEQRDLVKVEIPLSILPDAFQVAALDKVNDLKL